MHSMLGKYVMETPSFILITKIISVTYSVEILMMVPDIYTDSKRNIEEGRKQLTSEEGEENGRNI